MKKERIPPILPNLQRSQFNGFYQGRIKGVFNLENNIK
jgi:hypothetical protein